MLYALRDLNNNIVSLFANPQPQLGATEQVPDDSVIWQPPVVKSWSSLEFLLLFTDSERLAIAAIAITDHVVSDFRLLAAAAGTVAADNPLVIQGLSYLVLVNLITQDRMTAILNS